MSIASAWVLCKLTGCLLSIMTSGASPAALLVSAALVLWLNAASAAPEDAASLMIMSMQWLPQAQPTQACISPTEYCNGGQLNTCIKSGCDLWTNNQPHCLAPDPGPANGSAAGSGGTGGGTSPNTPNTGGGAVRVCRAFNREQAPAEFNVARFFPAQPDGQDADTACSLATPLNPGILPQDLQAQLGCIAGGVQAGDDAWQQLWTSGGACTGMPQEDYYTLLADTFATYNPASVLAPGELQMNRSELIAALESAWGAEPWVACNAS
jgi:hypothetical protein